MRPWLLPTLLAITVVAVPAPAAQTPHWSVQQTGRLLTWLSAARDEGLGAVTPHVAAVAAAVRSDRPDSIDAAATKAAIDLLQALRHGCCNASLRTGWHIAPDPAWPDAGDAVFDAVSGDQIDSLFSRTKPSHPFYEGLRAAYARETDTGRRATLAANLDRWRWMPRNLGERYLLVNTAAFEASLWQDGRLVGRWKTVVGKTRSPTPIFAAVITAVVFNPWWEIPPDIAAENIADLLRNHPAQAAAKGYVRTGDRYRQRPGPTNALGRMKLVMPNGYHIYLHDTPSQNLFAQDVRAYSHGCVRVGDALGLATALLSQRPGWDREQVDALVATGQTRTVGLAAPIPVYIAYFTAEPDERGHVRYFPDIYNRDTGAKAPSDDGLCPR